MSVQSIINPNLGKVNKEDNWTVVTYKKNKSHNHPTKTTPIIVPKKVASVTVSTKPAAAREVTVANVSATATVSLPPAKPSECEIINFYAAKNGKIYVIDKELLFSLHNKNKTLSAVKEQIETLVNNNNNSLQEVSMRFSQRTISANAGNGKLPLVKLFKLISKGWDASMENPFELVEMTDKKLTSFDNRRLYCIKTLAKDFQSPVLFNAKVYQGTAKVSRQFVQTRLVQSHSKNIVSNIGVKNWQEAVQYRMEMYSQQGFTGFPSVSGFSDLPAWFRNKDLAHFNLRKG